MTRQGKRVAAFLLVFLIGATAILRYTGNKYQDPLEIYGGMSGDLDHIKVVDRGAGDISMGSLFGLSGSGPGMGLSTEKKRQVLEGLGYTFTETVEEAISYIDKDWDLGYSDFLAMIGMGEFDHEAGAEEWTPTCDWVYALDTEVYDVMDMYPQFIRGLLSISKGEVPIADVIQDDSQVDEETGEGTWIIELKYDGKPYTIRAKAMFDWLDCSVLNSINDILKKEGVEKRYYAMWNNFQGMTILFLTPDEARSFRVATGCKLFTSV